MRSWAWLHMDLAGLVYPKAAAEAPEPPASMSAQGHRKHDARGEEDFAGLRTYQVGDSPRHVAWKAYARGGDLLSKRFSGADTSSQWLDFAETEGTDTEWRLQVLTRWIVDAEAGAARLRCSTGPVTNSRRDAGTPIGTVASKHWHCSKGSDKTSG